MQVCDFVEGCKVFCFFYVCCLTNPGLSFVEAQCGVIVEAQCGVTVLLTDG